MSDSRMGTSSKIVRVGVLGAGGRMGQAVIAAIAADAHDLA
jgi:dihydrodipicolinate reductase